MWRQQLSVVVVWGHGGDPQQIHCVTDKHGKIVEGEEDAITNNFYVLAMQRDWDEEENELKWKIVEFMVLGSMPYN